MSNQDNSKNTEPVKKTRARWKQWLLRLVVFLLVLFIVVGTVLFLLFKNERFQNWAVDKATHQLSQDLNTNVSLEKIEFSFMDRLVFKNLLINDLHGDTLIYSGSLIANLNTNIFALLQRDLHVNEIYLEDAKVRITQNPEELLNSLNQIFKKGAKDPNKKSSKPLYLDVDYVSLKNVAFENNNLRKGNNLSVFVEEGDLTIDSLNLVDNQFAVREINLINPIVELELYEKPDSSILAIGEYVDPDILVVDTTGLPLIIEVANMTLQNGNFNLNNFRKSPERTSPETQLDFHRLKVSDINIDVADFSFNDYVYEAVVNNLSCQESSGFVLDKLAAQQLKITDRRIELNDMSLITPYSNLGDTLIFKFREFGDFDDFNNKVLMQGDFSNSVIAIRDIMTFAPKLNNNPFFVQNKNEVVNIDGTVKGRVNRLSGKNLNLKLGKGLTLNGDFAIRDITLKNEEMINLNVDRVVTTMQTLKLLIPNFNPPENFYKLGTLDFQGRFDGFFEDFVADGDLRTDLGRVKVDMRLDLKKGREKASYSGGLDLYDFDLAAWSGNPNFGIVTFSSEVQDGVGLTIETVNTDLSAVVEEFNFKGYTYRNLEMEGVLSQGKFDGDFVIVDDNIDFTFSGSAELVDSIPVLDFQANIKNLDLGKLKLVKEDLAFEGVVDVQLSDIDLSTMEGDAKVIGLKLRRAGKIYEVDSLTVHSAFDAFGKRDFVVNSEILSGQLNGYFDIQEVPEAMLQFFERNYPEYASRLNVASKKKELSQKNVFDFGVKIYDMKNLGELLDKSLDTLRNISIAGHFDGVRDSVDLLLELPYFKAGNVQLDSIYGKIMAVKDNAVIDASVMKTYINKNLDLAPIELLGFLENDTLIFDIAASNFTEVFHDLDLNGKFFLQGEDAFQVEFDDSDIFFLNEVWRINSDNYIRFGKGFVDAQNFVMEHANQQIKIESYENTGIDLSLSNFDLAFADSLFNDKNLSIGGYFNLNARADNIFKLEDMEALLEVDSFIINGKNWGKVIVDAKAPTIKEPINAVVSLRKDDYEMYAKGLYNPPNSTEKRYAENFFSFDIETNRFPINFLDYYIGNGVTGTEGMVNAKARLWGEPKELNIDGLAAVEGVETTLNYLGVRYSIPQGRARISNTRIDAEPNSYIYDPDGNAALLEGGLKHNRLKEWGVDVRVSSDKFIALDTDRDQNPLYYGYGVGAADIEITGSFKQPNFNINATTLAGTELDIPLTSNNEASEVSFITFKDKNEVIDSTIATTAKKLLGPSVNMNLTMTEDAEVRLIFDEQAGDIIKGRGESDLQIAVSSSGEFTMFGNYFIKSGEYLFTLYNIVNKPFTVKEGGTISWSGDPFTAQIDLEATYNSSTAPYNFIEEYVTDNPTAEGESRSSTNVDLTMELSGDLTKPDIKFDLFFPDLTGELKNYTDSKLNSIRQEDNELNRQIFGLIVMGGFLPSGNLSGSEVVTGINTLTEMLSNQLSIYLTEYLSQIITNNKVIDRIDFDVNYNIYNPGEFDAVKFSNLSSLNNELQSNLKTSMFNDRLYVNVGGNFDVNNNGDTPREYLAGDVIVEFILTKDRRYRAKFYTSAEPSFDGGRNNKTGLGINYRREFDTLRELFTRNKKRKN